MAVVERRQMFHLLTVQGDQRWKGVDEKEGVEKLARDVEMILIPSVLDAMNWRLVD